MNSFCHSWTCIVFNCVTGVCELSLRGCQFDELLGEVYDGCGSMFGGGYVGYFCDHVRKEYW